MKKKLREMVWNKYDKRCAYCGTEIEYQQMQVDHIAAKHLGGEDFIENYNPSCRQCNFYKGTHSIEGFKKRLATITERIKKPFIVRLAMQYGLISFKPFEGKFYFEKRKEQLVCDVCGSTDVIESTHRGRNCNRCNPL